MNYRSMILRSVSYRFLLCSLLLSLLVSFAAGAQPRQPNHDPSEDSWDWSFSSDESGGGSSYLGVDIADITTDRLAALKLKEEHGAEITMVDQDAPAGKAGVHVHDVILSLNGTAVDSAAQLRRMIKETPPGRIISLGISRDGEPLTIKVQLADRHKSMGWDPKNFEYKYEMPKIPPIPDIDIPVSVVVVHSSMRSGLMVENMSQQLGEFFGVKDGNGVLVRSVEKGSRGEKAGFRAGDVIVKVNNQRVHDASDFTHALRSSSGNASVTILREKREQNLTLTLPESKDSGALLEDSFDLPEITAETQEAVNRAGDEIARLGPLMETEKQAMEQAQEACWKNMEKTLQDSQRAMRDSQRAMRDKMREQQRKLEERQKKLRHELSGQWMEI